MFNVHYYRPMIPHSITKVKKPWPTSVHVWCYKCAFYLFSTVAPCRWSVFACPLPNYVLNNQFWFWYYGPFQLFILHILVRIQQQYQTFPLLYPFLIFGNYKPPKQSPWALPLSSLFVVSDLLTVYRSETLFDHSDRLVRRDHLSFYLNTCVTQERYTFMLCIVSSVIYRITWVITQGRWHTTPSMNQHMIIILRLLEDICTSWKTFTLIHRKW